MDLGFNLAPSNRDLKDPTSRRILVTRPDCFVRMIRFFVLGGKTCFHFLEKKVSLFWQTLKNTSSGAFLSVDVCYNLPTPLSRDLQLLGKILELSLMYKQNIPQSLHWGPVSKMLPVREAILVNLATSLQFLLVEEVTLCLCIYSCKQFYLMMNMGMDLIQWWNRFFV